MKDLEDMKRALGCLTSNIIASNPDAVGHVFCHTVACESCVDRCFCLSVCQIVERQINLRRDIKKATAL